MNDSKTSEGMMRLQCRKCETVYEVCNLPMDLFEVVKKMKSAKCPECNQGGKMASIYMGKQNESEAIQG